MNETIEKCINRVKDYSMTLNANYPFVLQKAAISNFLEI